MEKEINPEDTVRLNKAIVLVLPTNSVVRINNIELRPALNDDLTQTYILSMPTAEDFLMLDEIIACGNFVIEDLGVGNRLGSVSMFPHHWSKIFPHHWSKITYPIKAYINQRKSILDSHEIKKTDNCLSVGLTSIRITIGSMTIQIRDRDSLIVDLKNIKKEEEEDGE